MFSAFDGIFISLGFALFLVAVVGQFKFVAAFTLETYQAADEGKVPLWDRFIAGALSTILLAFEIYRGVSLLSDSNSTVLPGAAAASTVLVMVAYLFALWLHDWNEDPNANTFRKRIRLVLLAVLVGPIFFLGFLLATNPTIGTAVNIP